MMASSLSEMEGNRFIPNRAEALKVLRLMGDYSPILMLRGDADGFGDRWSIDGHPIQPVIATYLMKENLIVDSGATELGARKLVLTESGVQFRSDGLLWWDGLSLFEKLKVMIFG
jgi:hypothetical protein